MRLRVSNARLDGQMRFSNLKVCLDNLFFILTISEKMTLVIQNLTTR
jgi:hypothetical protein